MRWEKRGQIYKPSDSISWMRKYGMMPTPLYMPEKNSIRIFIGVTTIDNYGVTTYLDVCADDPSKVLFVEENQPTMDLGRPGTFDDCGAVPSCCVNINGQYFLYYVGFQRCQKVPYMLFPGLALSKDGKEFQRYSEAPILDRDHRNFLSFAAPYVMQDDNKYKMWLWIGSSWDIVKGKSYLSASIGYAESIDGLTWRILENKCITPNQPHEFSVGRPWVVREGGIYKMYYSVRHVEKLYRLGYAESTDGINWIRKDEELNIDVSKSGWDSQMICYPAVIKVNDRTYMFYNGNNNGETGFGWAELIE